MSILNSLTYQFQEGSLDTTGRLLQEKDIAHRGAIMANARGKPSAGQSHFKSPSGEASYYGFGADGWFYEAGVKQRTWRAGESIDDFADLVTDTQRWTFIGTDFSEGGIDPADTPFGKRLYATYVGPGAETYDRKGLMAFSVPNVNNAVLSGRAYTFGEGAAAGVNIENSLLLGIQQFASDIDYVFVGYVNTATFPFSVVQGHVIAGIVTVTTSVPLPAGTTEIEMMIEMDPTGSTYQSFYSTDLSVNDYGHPSWLAIGPVTPLGVGWPSNAVPRIHCEFPAGFAGGEHRLSDVRCEEGPWVGQQRSTWWLEVQDITNPTNSSGTQAECPDEVLVVWGRDADGTADLTLIDMDTTSDPLLWRRWQNFGVWGNKDWTHQKHFSPGWLDADEGHIVLTRDTKGVSGSAGDEKGEIWIVSLRWDKILVLNVDGVGVYLVDYNTTTGRLLREASTWGARRWYSKDTYSDLSHYDKYQVPATGSYFGTLSKIGTEAIVPAITYGVSVRRGDDASIYLAYGIQEVPTSLPDTGEYYSGFFQLQEDNSSLQYPRKIFRQDDSTLNVWDESDEAWVVVGISYERALWWMQALEDGPYDEFEGCLLRVDTTVHAFDNAVSAAYNEDLLLRNNDWFGGRGIDLNLIDSSPVGDELVFVSSGWMGGSHITLVWYDSGTPASSVVKTYGVDVSKKSVSHDLDVVLPAEEFPAWVMPEFPSTVTDLNVCRIASSSGIGEDSFLKELDGRWLAYGQWNGIGPNKEVRCELWRGVAVNRGDFVVEIDGKYIPPFAAGYFFGARDFLGNKQKYRISLGCVGEKNLRVRIGLLSQGAVNGGEEFFWDYSFMEGTGSSSSSSVVVPSVLVRQPGADLKFRIKRVDDQWTLLYWDVNTGAWKSAITFTGPMIPVIPFIQSYMVDDVGIPCSVGVELNSFQLAPSGDALGSFYHCPVDYYVKEYRHNYLSSAVMQRDLVPTSSSGSFVMGDAWVFPGVMPRP